MGVCAFAHNIIIMKIFLALFALVSVALAQASNEEVKEVMRANNEDGCLTCVDDIVKAIAECGADNANILECITDAIGAASDCFHCICEVLEIIGGFDGVCP